MPQVWCASGVLGFFGEGYWYHRHLKRFGLDFRGAMFGAKTTTLLPNKGNMALKEDFTPRDRFPNCIVVHPIDAVALNAVSLSGPGAEALFNAGYWQAREEPSYISFMSIAKNFDERYLELCEFVRMFRSYLPGFRGRVGLQVNYTCPSVGIDPLELTEDAIRGLTKLGELRRQGVWIMPKMNALFPVSSVKRITDHPNADGLCSTNTILFGQLADQIDWRGLFGSKGSPLAHRGYAPGGLSGAPLLPIVIDWITRVRRAGVQKHINGGGGILSYRDARRVLEAGANSVFLGSIAFLRPWRVRGIIRNLNSV